MKWSSLDVRDSRHGADISDVERRFAQHQDGAPTRLQGDIAGDADDKARVRTMNRQMLRVCSQTGRTRSASPFSRDNLLIRHIAGQNAHIARELVHSGDELP